MCRTFGQAGIRSAACLRTVQFSHKRHNGESTEEVGMIRKGTEARTEERENMRGGAGAVTIRHHFEKSEFTARCRLCATLSLPAGAGIGRHRHEEEDEVFIITRGAGLLDEGGTQTRVKAGDAILTGKGGSHAIRNDGPEPLEIVAVILCY